MANSNLNIFGLKWVYSIIVKSLFSNLEHIVICQWVRFLRNIPYRESQIKVKFFFWIIHRGNRPYVDSLV